MYATTYSVHAERHSQAADRPGLVLERRARARAYAAAAARPFPSPSTPWTATTFKNRVLDNDSTRNRASATCTCSSWSTAPRGPAGSPHNSFDCKSYDSSGNLIGELKWDYPNGGCGSGPTNGVADLTINGTVFIDGNLVFDSCDYAVYQGRGTIYVNGTVTFGNGTKICAKAISGSPCAGNYDPNSNLLEIVAVNAGNASPGFTT